MDNLPPLRGEDVTIVSHEKEASDKGEFGPKSHVVYIIEVVWGGGLPWKVKKRYSEFEEFHKRCVHVYGSRQVPNLPKKKKIPVGGTAKKYVAKRTLKLQMYLREVIDQCHVWFTMTDEQLSGPGKILGINDILFDFLEFARYAIISKPQTPVIEGDGVAFISKPRHRETAVRRPLVLPMMNGMELNNIIELVSKVDLCDDDSRLTIVSSAFEQLRSEGKSTYINILQAKTIIQEVFFGENRLSMCRMLAPLVQDPENYNKLGECIDFDEDVATLADIFDEQIKVRDSQVSNNSIVGLRDEDRPVSRMRGVPIAPA
eukprot:TRINITY_DN6692_c0_g1_i1.p1 TRINITY_DN6692_c0_g1~~TRINITY_DN6692_c0_g1_i1.p1  ORF type:complete len:316 (+),score=39.71 TRINITY_DN6692_c0_g1_i1:92-1039(+)